MITDEQVDYIEAQIKESKIKNKSLSDDLLDHMCCLVEINMKKGLTFEQAYQKAFLQTSPNGYEEIQNETLFLLNYNKIMNMKRLTYISGFVFSLAFSAGTLFKILHQPGAMLLLGIGLFGFSFIFIPIFLVSKYKELAVQVMSERLKWIFGAASVILLGLSSLMKIMHLMGAGVMLATSFLIFGFGFLPFLFFRMYKKSVETL